MAALRSSLAGQEGRGVGSLVDHAEAFPVELPVVRLVVLWAASRVVLSGAFREAVLSEPSLEGHLVVQVVELLEVLLAAYLVELLAVLLAAYQAVLLAAYLAEFQVDRVLAAYPADPTVALSAAAFLVGH